MIVGSRSGPPNTFKQKNAITITPDDVMQDKYDWLKSASRDAVMGAIAYDNRRVMIRTPGKYTGNLTIDTHYVVIQDEPGVWDTGTITHTSNIRHVAPDPLVVTSPVNNRQKAVPRFIDSCSDHTTWTVGSGVTATTDTSSYPGAGKASVKLAYGVMADSATRAACRLLTNPISVVGYTITLVYYIDHTEMDWYGEYTQPATFYFVLSSDTSASTNVLYYRRAYFTLPRSPGWHTVDCCVSNFSPATNNTGGGFNPNNVTAWGILYITKATTGNHAAFNIYVDRLTVTPSYRTKGAVMLQFDDGLESQYDEAALYMAKYGFPGVLYAESQNLVAANI